MGRPPPKEQTATEPSGNVQSIGESGGHWTMQLLLLLLLLLLMDTATSRRVYDDNDVEYDDYGDTYDKMEKYDAALASYGPRQNFGRNPYTGVYGPYNGYSYGSLQEVNPLFDSVSQSGVIYPLGVIYPRIYRKSGSSWPLFPKLG